MKTSKIKSLGSKPDLTTNPEFERQFKFSYLVHICFLRWSLEAKAKKKTCSQNWLKMRFILLCVPFKSLNRPLQKTTKRVHKTENHFCDKDSNDFAENQGSKLMFYSTGPIYHFCVFKISELKNTQKLKVWELMQCSENIIVTCIFDYFMLPKNCI